MKRSCFDEFESAEASGSAALFDDGLKLGEGMKELMY